MHRILILILFLLVVSLTGKSQEKVVLTPAVADSLSWEHYQEKAWPALLKVTEESLRQGIDFYYLRVRAGVAAFEMKKFRKAVVHLSAAHEAYKEDEFTTGYLHASLVMAGRQDEARLLAGRLTADTRARLGIRLQGALSSLSAENYLSGNTNHASLVEENIAEAGSYSNYRSVLRRQWYTSVGADLHLSPRFNLYTNLSHIAIDRTQHFTSVPNLVEATMPTTTAQWQLFSQGRLLTGKGWRLFSSLSFLKGESPYHYPEVASPGVYALTGASLRYTDWLFNTGFAREMALVTPLFSVTGGEINGFRQIQLNGRLTIYPFGNSNFYLVSEGSLHFDEGTDHPKSVFTQKAAVKAGPVWLTGEATRGVIARFSTAEGLVVYNMPETVSAMTGATLWIPLFAYKMNAALRYQLSEKKGTTFVYTNPTDYYKKYYTFNDHSLLISLTWNF